MCQSGHFAQINPDAVGHAARCSLLSDILMFDDEVETQGQGRRVIQDRKDAPYDK